MCFVTVFSLTLDDMSGVELRQKNPATDPSQQGIERGSRWPTLDSVIVQMYFPEKVLKFPELCVSLQDVVHQTFGCSASSSHAELIQGSSDS